MSKGTVRYHLSALWPGFWPRSLGQCIELGSWRFICVYACLCNLAYLSSTLYLIHPSYSLCEMYIRLTLQLPWLNSGSSCLCDVVRCTVCHCLGRSCGGRSYHRTDEMHMSFLGPRPKGGSFLGHRPKGRLIGRSNSGGRYSFALTTLQVPILVNITHLRRWRK
jgi:hypothetical protein